MQLTREEVKKLAGIHSAKYVEQGMKIGLGTGSTVYYLIKELGQRVKQGLEISIIPTSLATETLALENGLTVIPIEKIYKLDLTIDGADEIDPAGNMIKGGGGALLQEKIVASASDQLIIIADEAKLVKQLGHFPLPVEILPFAFSPVINKIRAEFHLKRIELRDQRDQPFLTDHHHYILDCYFEEIQNPLELNDQLHRIPGVVETGLFIKMANRSVVAFSDGHIETFEYH